MKFNTEKRQLLFHKLTIFLIAFLLFVPGRLWAQNYGTCPRHETHVNVKNEASYKSLLYDYGKSVPELTSISGKKNEIVFGLFRSELAFSIRASSQIIRISSKLSCLKRIDVDIVFRLNNPTVHVGREFKNTPIFNRVYEHEMRHARIHIENYKRYLDHLKPELSKYLKGLTVRIAPPDKINNAVADKLKKFIKPRIDVMNRNVKKFNDDFDASSAERENAKTIYKAYLNMVKTR